MRGTVVLLGGHESHAVYAEHLRANGLLVYEAVSPTDVQAIAPDVIVTVFSGNTSPSAIRDLRSRVDHATSIIVASSRGDRQAAHEAGADSVLLMPAPPGEILYEVQRALILRRSGRRLPQNRDNEPNNKSNG